MRRSGLAASFNIESSRVGVTRSPERRRASAFLQMNRLAPLAAMRLILPSSRAAVTALLLLACAPSHAIAPFETHLGEAADSFSPVSVMGAGLWRLDSVLTLPGPLGDRLPGHSLATPALLRIGLTQTVEFRAAGGLMPTQTAIESSTDRVRRLHGFTDGSFGAKWRVRGGDAGWLPGVAWLADVETNNGSPAFRGRDFRPSLRATAEWELRRNLSLSVMPGIYRERDDDTGRHYAAGVLAVTLGKAWTPRLRTFVEVAGERLSSEQHGASLVNFDTGLALAFSRALRLDMVVSRHLSGSGSQDVRAGLSTSAQF
jgi:hypothetical protein